MSFQFIQFYLPLFIFVGHYNCSTRRETYSKGGVALKSSPLSLCWSHHYLPSFTPSKILNNTPKTKTHFPKIETNKNISTDLFLWFRFETQKWFLHIHIIGEKDYQWTHKLFFFWSSASSSFSTPTPQEPCHQAFSTQTLITITTKTLWGEVIS